MRNRNRHAAKGSGRDAWVVFQPTRNRAPRSPVRFKPWLPVRSSFVRLGLALAIVGARNHASEGIGLGFAFAIIRSRNHEGVRAGFGFALAIVRSWCEPRSQNRERQSCRRGDL